LFVEFFCVKAAGVISDDSFLVSGVILGRHAASLPDTSLH